MWGRKDAVCEEIRMSDNIVIEAEPRTVIGKKVAQLRRDGWVPATVYGKGESVNVQIERKALRRALRVVGTTQMAHLEIDGKKRPVLVRDIQQHLTRGDVLHVDFLVVDMSSTLKVEAELVATGESAPAAEGLGVGVLALRSVEIEALPDALISEIEVDLAMITSPDVVITVADLSVPEGVTILTDPETPVARFEYAALPEEEEEGELEDEFGIEAEDVEVIGKGKQDEDEEEFE